ncbi:MAG: hypothetical protein KUG82_23045 [Pseudomonadales bacterium]|nr:hypothetical protein [Pseudomonadales bacterium]
MSLTHLIKKGGLSSIAKMAEKPILTTYEMTTTSQITPVEGQDTKVPENLLPACERQISDLIADDRRTCTQCAHLAPSGLCLASRRREIIAGHNYHPVNDILRRCEGYAPKLDDPDRRTGRDLWPKVVLRNKDAEL